MLHSVVFDLGLHCLPMYHKEDTRPQGYKAFFMLNSTEHQISTAYENQLYRQIKKFLALSLSDVGILTFMSRINFVLS